MQFASTSTAAGYGVESASGKMVVCFAGGTRITTPDGQIAVENLKTGDKVTTADGLTETITWIGKRVLNAQELAENPNLRPIRIKRNVLGPGYPDRDLRVSPQHRILMSGNRVMRGNLTSSFFRWCTSPSQSFIRKCRNV
ncbi:Hint domain-containing protein [Thalassobius sp. I31.1]|uniref:Hint domain-containing protein n=1 Tax=Thalassobius sp. I31.1 TaxID=2109912 RepID=UPI000D1BFB8C|nr:Hint domain-containing protein [Thalassobius sp. I31.1]